MRLLLACLLLCAACKHSTSSSSTSHTETSTVTDSTSSESGATTTTTVVTEAPGETTTTTEEFAPPDKETAPEGAVPDAAPVGDAALTHRTTPRQGPLVKRTVTIIKSGQETTQTRQEATTAGQSASETKAAGKVDTTAKAKDEGGPAVGCAVAGWMWGVLIVAGIVGIILGALKLRP